MILLTNSSHIDSFVQFITVLFIFLFVLVITYFVTRWISKFQKTQTTGRNIEVIETGRISSSKYIQIVRIGMKYYAIAVCKDTVTMLSEVAKEDIDFKMLQSKDNTSFREVLKQFQDKTEQKNEHSDREK